jgi:hypothetical protein
MSYNHDFPGDDLSAADTPAATPADALPAGYGCRQPRHDGWTLERQAEFLDDLGQHGNVARAAGAVGMSAASAYRLRGREAKRDPRGAFTTGWRAATAMAYIRLRDLAFERIENGTVQTHFYRGNLVGTRLIFSDRLLLGMLNHLRPAAEPGRAAAAAAAAADPADAYAAAMDAFAVAAETGADPVMPATAVAAEAAAGTASADASAAAGVASAGAAVGMASAEAETPSDGEGPHHAARAAAARARLRRGEDPHPVRFPGRTYAPRPDDFWLELYPDGLTADDLASEDEAELAAVGLSRDGAVREGGGRDESLSRA